MAAGWLAAGGVASVLGIAIGLRGRALDWVPLAVLAVGGAAVGVGGMLLRPDPTALEFGLLVGGLALLFPFHARVVFGRLGRRRRTR